jgi:preprotein translocase subunit SecY
MNTLFEKLKAIYEIEDLRNRLLITIGFLAVYRFGSFVITWN